MFMKEAELRTPPSFWAKLPCFFSELIGWLIKLGLVVFMLYLYFYAFYILVCLLVVFELGV